MKEFELIRNWAYDRNLIKGSNPQAQMLKMTEEVGELAHAIARSKLPEAKDAIGDCVVVLTILAEQLGLDIESCIDAAYEQIKDRKGRMVDGVFVKSLDNDTQ
jgi:NTP pyrophosphatase (non-canonical NTP hydrolase)